MSGLDVLRARRAEAMAACEVANADISREQAKAVLLHRLRCWDAAIQAVSADYELAEPDGFEDQEYLDPAPSEEDLAAAAKAVAMFQGAVQASTVRDQPPAPDDLVGLGVYGPEDAAAWASEASTAMAAVSRQPHTTGDRTPREGPTWNKARLELGEQMWRVGRTAAEIFAAVNSIPAPQTVKTKQDVYNKAHVMGWKRDLAAGAAPPSPVPEAAPTASADDDEASPEEIKAAIRAGKRAKAIAWEFGIELEEAQKLCAEVDAEAKAA